MKKPRIILYPEVIKSERDGDSHFISSDQLARLYRVPLKRCIVVHRHRIAGFKDEPGDIHLHPRYSGAEYERIAEEIRPHI